MFKYVFMYSRGRAKDKRGRVKYIIGVNECIDDV